VAIYHFSAKIVSRRHGRSIIGAAAYRAGMRLREHSTNTIYDYTHKHGVEHTEILAPTNAPGWARDRSQLWNAVDHREKRKDSQLARDLEIALPVELDNSAQVELLRDFARREFVSKGMIADCAIHRDNPNNPHAHVLLTLRHIGPNGFGLKERSWNEKSNLMAWRLGWAEFANKHLARSGLAVTIDHRTLREQGLDLIPGRKIGVSLERQKSDCLPLKIADRVTEQRFIARENGARIVADPNVAIEGLTHYQPTFTKHDIARFLRTRTDGTDQFREANLKVTTSSELVVFKTDDRGRKRYTSREMLEVESEMLCRVELMSLRDGHRLTDLPTNDAFLRHDLSDEQSRALDYLVASGDLKCLVATLGTGTSQLLEKARQIWEAQGYTVKGAALSRIAAEGLTLSAGISARTLASYELAWKNERDPLTPKDILIIDEAGMVGTRQVARVLEIAEKAKAKVILVGDPEQLQAIEAGAAFRGITAESGVVELTESHRQTADWQKEATSQLGAGATKEALSAYEREGSIVQTITRDRARSELIDEWSLDAQQKPDQTRLILACTRDDVGKLNELARSVRRKRYELGYSEQIETERGMREFAMNDRLFFLRSDRSLNVKNGTLGTITGIKDGVLQARLDNTRQQITVDTRLYRDLDHGYAATVHKAQGTTVDRTYILATSHLDRHATYVALTRHREGTSMFYAAEDFGRAGVPDGHIDLEAKQQFFDVLSRAAPEELVHDYLDRDNTPPKSMAITPPTSAPGKHRSVMDEIDAMQRRGADAWLEKQLAREQNPSHDQEIQKKDRDREDRGIDDDFSL